MDIKKPNFFSSLEGIRGYAFLAVFFLHYNSVIKRPSFLRAYPSYLAFNLGWFLVPIFFALSGFLITRVLLATREREGYFRVFYFRRAVRVLPLYYVVVAIVTAIAIAAHWDLRFRHLLYLVYLQNFCQLTISNKIQLNHFWSLAVEEQFYLLWPVAIRFLRTEKSILNFSYALIASCTIFRLAWPLWHISMSRGYYITPTRMDGIILGAVLAIHYERRTHWAWFIRAAKFGIPLLLMCMLAVTLVVGSTYPDTYIGIAFCIPAMNLIGMGFVILALTPENIVAKACSGPAICSFGKLSYGLYIFHILYYSFFLDDVSPALGHYMPHHAARFLSTLLALGLTTGLAWVTYKLIEEPAMNLKEKFKYGPVVERPARLPLFGRPVLVFGPAE